MTLLEIPEIVVTWLIPWHSYGRILVTPLCTGIYPLFPFLPLLRLA
jgi:hypothetical protein